nr:PREDICTED: zinc finger protein 276 [Anolis carolinensis]|eukprot:XP_008122159.2 PREDICTED: zinc finger protein 276 [Anolis carolinensis]
MKRDRRGRFLPSAKAAPSSSCPSPLTSPRSRRRKAQEEEEEEEEKEKEEEKKKQAQEGAPGATRSLSTGHCRLCHGKFSARSLRNAFGKPPAMDGSPQKQQQQPRRLDRVFFADFQHLLGVAARPDPSLPQSVCKKCHAQFYKCRSVLKAFIQKVNLSPVGALKPRPRSNAAPSPLLVTEGNASSLGGRITSSPQCLHNLVLWAHNHAGSCQVTPSLRSVLSSGYCGVVVQAVWGCSEGHDYVLSPDVEEEEEEEEEGSGPKQDHSKGSSERVAGNGVDAEGARAPCIPSHCGPDRTAAANSEAASPEPGTENQLPESPDAAPSQEVSRSPLQEGNLPRPGCPVNGGPGPLSENPVPPAALDERVKDEFSDLSEGDSSSSDEEEDGQRECASDDFFQPFEGKRMPNNRKPKTKGTKLEGPKIRKKPGPKPGWKKNIKCEREELPTIYKCPYQGCTAVYRGADGMKKHIKEHHEEVRARPCPHPGCNKVFMIDRYLQRHVKLIHTEVRNYICDECGQTFKQRKHLSVHQMRHSGAKPLQCEICGFQCRQRASLKYHMTKHKAEAELEFACDLCGKRFEKAHNLNVHMSMVHPLIQTQDKAKAKAKETDSVAEAPDTETTDSRTVKLELRASQPQQEPT